MPMHNNPATWLLPRAVPPTETEDGAPDALDETAAAEFLGAAVGRFACGECADNRDAAERAERQLAKAHALLRILARTEQRAAKREFDEDPRELAIIGFAQMLAAIKARIEIYFQAERASR
jgi:hypothetical protein